MFASTLKKILYGKLGKVNTTPTSLFPFVVVYHCVKNVKSQQTFLILFNLEFIEGMTLIGLSILSHHQRNMFPLFWLIYQWLANLRLLSCIIYNIFIYTAKRTTVSQLTLHRTFKSLEKQNSRVKKKTENKYKVTLPLPSWNDMSGYTNMKCLKENDHNSTWKREEKNDGQINERALSMVNLTYSTLDLQYTWPLIKCPWMLP